MPDETFIEDNGKTYVTEASGLAVIVIWVATKLFGLEMSPEVAVSIVGVIIIIIRYLGKKGWI